MAQCPITDPTKVYLQCRQCYYCAYQLLGTVGGSRFASPTSRRRHGTPPPLLRQKILMPPPGIPADIAYLTGPQLFGYLFNYCLFGILSVQVYSYYLLGFKDNRAVKALIYGLYLVEWLQLIMSTHDAVEVLAMGWGDTNALVSPQWLWIQIPILTGIISCTVQFFYSWRIYVLGKSLAISLSICLISLMQLAAAAATGIMARIINDLQLLQVRTKAPCSVWLGGSATCDITIAASMLYFLWSERRRSAVSEKLVVRLMRLTVETGALTASMAVVDLALFVGFQHNNLHMALGISLSKLYTNALMMLFNNRVRLQSYRGGVRSGQRAGLWVSSGDSEGTASGGGRGPGGPGTGSQPIVLQKFSGDTMDGGKAGDGSADHLSDLQKADAHGTCSSGM
ncbi:hypothetical protein C8Q78DRAFT_1021968 [Trametes maxima]|nr:hypothetical protein C8Q78DRAFT_1021968 [Trametes maxima]